MRLAWLNQLESLLYPPRCRGCRALLFWGDAPLCTRCLVALRCTAVEERRQRLEEKFWGHLPLGHVATLWDLQHRGCGQAVIHALKYDNRPDLAYFLGVYYGLQLVRAHFADCVLLPIPLHPRRERERGYNQSLHLARGLARVLRLPLLAAGLKRTRATPSQLGLGRGERLRNMRDAFAWSAAGASPPPHVCLVDDIITTGATMLAAAEPLLRAGSLTISLVTLGSGASQDAIGSF